MESINLDDDVLIQDSMLNKSESETKKRSRQQTSDVWNFFTRLGSGKDGIERAQCNACKAEYKIGGHKYGTSTLKRHLPKCKMLKFHDVGQMILDGDMKLRCRKIDQRIQRELCAAAIIQHDLSFSFVEYGGIRAWVKYINPDVTFVSRNTILADINKIYKREKVHLKQILANIPNKICLTSDVWTACTSEGYICLTAHFVDDNWKLNSKILNFAHMPPPHTGEELATKLYEFLKEWGIEKKVFSVTLDNASNNNSMKDILREQLRLHDSLLCDGEFFHVRCSAHILNLIVQEGLKVASEALKRIRESVKYVKGSESRILKFEECVQQVGNIDTSIGLRLDVSTRWNSTYMMLDSAIKYKKAFASLKVVDRNYKDCPSAEEWKRGEKICEFLEPFYDITNLISGSSYPTSNLYFMQVWKIECLLLENLKNEDLVIKDMCQKMKEKFDKYWNDYSIVLAFGAILDPRIKLAMLEYFYSKVDAFTCQEKIKNVRTMLYKLFEQYANSSVAPSSSQSQALISFTPRPSEGGRLNKGKKILDEIYMFESQTITNAGKSQLDLYLEEPKLEFRYFEDLDVLEYWKINKHRFPILSVMACDVLAIPITTVASESAFSIGARVLNKYRSRTLPDKVEALICTRNWLHGFSFNDGDEDAMKVKTTLSKEGSNTPYELLDENEEQDNEDDVNLIGEREN